MGWTSLVPSPHLWCLRLAYSWYMSPNLGFFFQHYFYKEIHVPVLYVQQFVPLDVGRGASEVSSFHTPRPSPRLHVINSWSGSVLWLAQSSNVVVLGSGMSFKSLRHAPRAWPAQQYFFSLLPLNLTTRSLLTCNITNNYYMYMYLSKSLDVWSPTLRSNARSSQRPQACPRIPTKHKEYACWMYHWNSLYVVFLRAET